MPVKKFQRKIENFVCLQCGRRVEGTGYTNHCPQCLFSRHVDINPGDRRNECRGLMRPISSELARGKFKVIHECELCGRVTKTKSGLGDNMDILIKLSNEPY